MEPCKPKVLVIEDEDLLLQAITKKLEINNIEAVGFNKGKESLKYLEQNSAHLPDLIWLDYYLPDISGLEIIREIKKKKEWANIPVCVVSNSANPEKVHNMLALGAQKYFLKAEQRLEDIVNEIVELIEEGMKNGR